MEFYSMDTPVHTAVWKVENACCSLKQQNIQICNNNKKRKIVIR